MRMTKMAALLYSGAYLKFLCVWPLLMLPDDLRRLEKRAQDVAATEHTHS
jgi:hypothetical protein